MGLWAKGSALLEVCGVRLTVGANRLECSIKVAGSKLFINELHVMSHDDDDDDDPCCRV